MSFDNLTISGVTSVEDWASKYNALVSKLQQSLQGEINLPLSLEGAALLTNGYNNLSYIEDAKLHLSFLSTFSVGIYPCRILTITGDMPTHIRIGSTDYPLIFDGVFRTGDIVYLNFYTNSDDEEVCETLPTLTNIFSNESLSLLIHSLFKSNVGGELRSSLIPKLPLILNNATEITSTSFSISYSFTDEVYPHFRWMRLYYWTGTYNELSSPYVAVSLNTTAYSLGSTVLAQVSNNLQSSAEYRLKIVAKGRVRNYETNEVVVETAAQNSQYINSGTAWTSPANWVSGNYTVKLYSGVAEPISVEADDYYVPSSNLDCPDTYYPSPLSGAYYKAYGLETFLGIEGGLTTFGNFSTNIAEKGSRYRYYTDYTYLSQIKLQAFSNGRVYVTACTAGLLSRYYTSLPIAEHPQQLRTETVHIAPNQTFVVRVGAGWNTENSNQGYIIIEPQT